ncbi:AraC family transcriptional regulator [Roseibium sp. MMSF_3412]|uniref:helix-turn-helix domain-containing protein n=1 Tax=Roseibium sp. MMSF_3412 TaxID=3046712 RepID=UPI00274024E6|nr:AraC family transcriptional regulator [Roseibium sp. MMSF_3412]
MISIPVSFLLAAVFFGLGMSVLFWRVLPRLCRVLFVVFFALLCIEAGLVGLRFAHGVVDLIALQRSLPVWIAPSLYLGFAALALPKDTLQRSIVRNGSFAAFLSLAMLLPVQVPGFVDGLIALSFALYTVLLVRLWAGGPDRLSQAPTGQARFLHRLLAVAILIMLATIATDVWIALLFTRQMPETASLVISYASLAFIITALGVAVFVARQGVPRRKSEKKEPANADNKALADKARQVLIEQNLYRDPAMTLTRFARRTGVPDRDLSIAINEVAGINVSQFVNQVRLEEAARLLTETDEPVTRIHEQVGFLTRSNFYREFRRQFGDAPGAFRKKAQPSSEIRSR